MLVYSVGSKQSFDMIKVVRDKIMNESVSLVFTWYTTPY